MAQPGRHTVAERLSKGREEKQELSRSQLRVGLAEQDRLERRTPAWFKLWRIGNAHIKYTIHINKLLV
jgi:hypothetical protein